MPSGKTDTDRITRHASFNIPLPLPAPVCLAHAELHFWARRRVDTFPVSAEKYISEEIKTSVRLCESVLSAMSLLRPPLFHYPTLPLPAPVCLEHAGLCFGAQEQAYDYSAIWALAWWESRAWGWMCR